MNVSKGIQYGYSSVDKCEKTLAPGLQWIAPLCVMVWLVHYGATHLVKRETIWHAYSVSVGAVRLNAMTIAGCLLGGLGIYSLVRHLARSRQAPSLDWRIVALAIWFLVLIGIGILRGNAARPLFGDVIAIGVWFLVFAEAEFRIWHQLRKGIWLAAAAGSVVMVTYALRHTWEDRGSYYGGQAATLFEGTFLAAYLWFTLEIQSNYQKCISSCLILLAGFAAVVSETRGLFLMWVLQLVIGGFFFLRPRNVFMIAGAAAVFTMALVQVSDLVNQTIVSRFSSLTARHAAVTGYGKLYATGRVEELEAFLRQLNGLEYIIGRGAGGTWDRSVMYSADKWSDIEANLDEPDLHSAYGTMILKGGVPFAALFGLTILLIGVRAVRETSVETRAIGMLLLLELLLWVFGGQPWSFTPRQAFYSLALGWVVSAKAGSAATVVVSSAEMLQQTSRWRRLSQRRLRYRGGGPVSAGRVQRRTLGSLLIDRNRRSKRVPKLEQ